MTNRQKDMRLSWIIFVAGAFFLGLSDWVAEVKLFGFVAAIFIIKSIRQDVKELPLPSIDTWGAKTKIFTVVYYFTMLGVIIHYLAVDRDIIKNIPDMNDLMFVVLLMFPMLFIALKREIKTYNENGKKIV